MEQEPKPRKNSYRDNLANTLRELRDQGDKEVAQRLLENKRETDLYKKEHDDHRQELSISRSERKEKNETIQKLYNSFEKSIGYKKLIEEELSKIDNNSTGFDKVESVFEVDDVSLEITKQDVNTGEYKKISMVQYTKEPVLIYNFPPVPYMSNKLGLEPKSVDDFFTAVEKFKKDYPDKDISKIILSIDKLEVGERFKDYFRGNSNNEDHSNLSSLFYKFKEILSSDPEFVDYLEKEYANFNATEHLLRVLREDGFTADDRKGNFVADEYFIGGGSKRDTANNVLHRGLSYKNAPWFIYAKELNIDSISESRFEEYLPTDKFNWCDKDCLERDVFNTLPEEVRPLASLEIIKRNFQERPKVFDVYFCGKETDYDLNFSKVSDDGRIWDRLFVPFLNNDNFKKCCVEIISPLVAKMDTNDVIENDVLLDRLNMIGFPMEQFMEEAKDLMEKNIEYEKAKFNKYWSE